MLTGADWYGRVNPVAAEAAGGNLGLSLREHLDNQDFMRQKLLQSSIESAAQMQQQGSQFQQQMAERDKLAQATTQLKEAQMKSLDAWRQSQEQDKKDKVAVLAKQHQDVADFLKKYSSSPASGTTAATVDPGNELPTPAATTSDPGGELSQAPVLPNPTPTPTATAPTPQDPMALLAQFPGAASDPLVRNMMTQRSSDARANMVQDRIDKRQKETQAAIAQRQKDAQALKQAAKDEKPVVEKQTVDGKDIWYIRNPQTGHFQLLSQKSADQAKSLQFKLTGIDGQISELSKVADKTTTQENHLTRLQSDRAGLLAQLMALTNTPAASAPAATSTGTTTPKKLTYDPTTDTLK